MNGKSDNAIFAQKHCTKLLNGILAKVWVVILIVLVSTGRNEAEDFVQKNVAEGNAAYYVERLHSVGISPSLLRAGRQSFVQSPPEQINSRVDLFSDSHENVQDSRDQLREKRDLAFLFGRGRRGKNTEVYGATREEDARAAEAILRNIVSNNSLVENIPAEVVYWDDQAIAAIFSQNTSGDNNGGGESPSATSKVTNCRILEVNKPEEVQEVLKMLEAENKLIVKAGFHTMVKIITSCKDLDLSDEPAPDTPTTRNPVVALLSEKRVNVWSIVSGILPGTKWCGTGDIAKDYDDLGKEREVDKCCRAHDLCPTKVMAFRNRYGYVNWSFYTKSHCDCDDYFYNCLKKTGSPTADAMGTFYFNVLRVQCVDDPQPGLEDSEHRKLVEKEVRKEF